MNSALILQLVVLSAIAAYPMAWVQRRLAQWVQARVLAKNPHATFPAPITLHRSALSFFTRAVILIAMLILFRYMLSE